MTLRAPSLALWPDALQAPRYALIAVGRPVRGEFTYLVPDALAPRLVPGVRVRAPFGRSTILGFYLGPGPEPSPELAAKIRPLEAVLDDTPALTADLVELLRFAAQHYRYPLGEAMKAALPPGLTDAKDAREAKADVVWQAQATAGVDPNTLARAPAQKATLGYLLAVGGSASVVELELAIPGARETLKKLQARGLVTLTAVEVVKTVREGLAAGRPLALTPEQAAALKVLEGLVDAGSFAPVLLHGVTGSGKTEVYLRLVEYALAQGKGALVLVPEIALTPQLVGRFQSRFGQGVALLHSGLKDRERLFHWQALRAGRTRIAVGVRSAIFAPVERLGVLVVDEEHDPSFKQDEKLRYQARDLAVVRARQAGAVVVLGSATPSLESYENARRGRYQLLELRQRVDDRPMPVVSLVDLRIERPRTTENRHIEPPVLSPSLREAIGETLARGQQVILFLNRRGHSTFVVCGVCGQGLKCHQCDVSLTHHLSQRRLVCHYCGEQRELPPDCPSCHGPLLRLGVGTERVEAEVAAGFPQARVARLDRDAASTTEALTELLASFARRELDVLVGTQMVAKGHDFPGVTLVCVALADTALALPDFRAAERTFQLLTQVAGRAGRGADAGRVLVQTYAPEALPIARVMNHDFVAFAQEELKRRKALAWPPYARLAQVRIEGPNPTVTMQVAQKLGGIAARALPPASHGVRLLGPAPAPLSKLKGLTRWQLLLKGPSHAALAGPLNALEAALAELPSAVKVVLDVDPSAML